MFSKKKNIHENWESAVCASFVLINISNKTRMKRWQIKVIFATWLFNYTCSTKKVHECIVDIPLTQESQTMDKYNGK